MKKSPTTTFGDMYSTPNNGNSATYSRTESMPGASASIRLALDEKRRAYNAQKANVNAQLAKEREQKSRDAFFTLLGKGGPSPIVPPPVNQSPLRANPTSRQGHQSMDAQQYESLSRDMQQLMAEVKRISTDQVDT